MKIASSLFFITFLFSECKDSQQQIAKSYSNRISYINYHADTVVYKLIANDSLGWEKYIVVKKIFIPDSSYNNENEGRKRLDYNAYKYNNDCYITIFVEEPNGKLKPIWVFLGYYTGDYIELEAVDVDFSDILHHCYPPIIRIFEKYRGRPDFRCLNIKVHTDHSWELLSKEKLDLFENSPHKGYCIDSINLNVYQRKIDVPDTLYFSDIFSDWHNWWKCI